eukprot:g16788.t1
MEGESSYEDGPISPTPSVTPVISWQTPWSQHPVSQETYEATPSRRRRQQHEPLPSRQEMRQESLQREREHVRGQRRMNQQQQHRQASLELLEARSINRALLQQQRQDREDILILRDENDALRAELRETRASLERARHEERRLSAAFKKQAALLSSEPDQQHGKAAAAADNAAAGPAKPNRRTDESLSASVWGDTSSTLSSSGAGSTDGDDLDSSRAAGTERSAPSAGSPPKPPLSPLAAAVPAGVGPELPDLLAATEQSLTGTVSAWLKGMQAACSEGLRQALVLPWLLHKLFYLSTELIDERREELLNIFVGGAGEGAREEESAYMLRHLRRHYRTVFPLSGDNLRTAVHNVMMALAHSMIDSEEWNPSAKDPIAVQSALAASGLEQIVQEYLTIAVLCCLQHPVMTFTDDLGEVERYAPERHAEPLDGEAAREWCIIIFPAFVEAGGVPGQERVIGKRFVLNHDKLPGEDA